MTGQMMVFIGIGLAAVSLVAFIIVSIVFAVKKRKMLHKIYDEQI